MRGVQDDLSRKKAYEYFPVAVCELSVSKYFLKRFLCWGFELAIQPLLEDVVRFFFHGGSLCIGFSQYPVPASLTGFHRGTLE